MDKREILFRGKRVVNGEWVVGSLVKMGPVGYVHHFILPDYASAFCDIEVDPSTVGQYIGMADKNGRKIFEGDIIQRKGYTYPLGQVEPCGERIVRGVVTWMDDGRNAGYWAIDSRDEHGNQVNYIFDNTFSIVGNMYDNQELLKEA